MTKISILVKVNGAAWGKKYIEFHEGNIHLDLISFFSKFPSILPISLPARTNFEELNTWDEN